MKKSFLTAMTMAAALTAAAIPAAANISWDFVGKAFNDEGRLEYVEKHRVDYRDARIVESRTVYFDAQGRKIGELISDYRYGPRFGSYTFRDIRAGYVDGAEVLDQRIRINRKTRPEEPVETATIPKTDRQIVGQGFHHFIVDHLESIAAGQVFHIALVLPSRLDQFDFRIRKQSLEGNRLSVRLEIENWFLRLFAPHVEADYDLQTGKLLQYRGVSNLADPQGRHPVVTIEYEYPGI